MEFLEQIHGYLNTFFRWFQNQWPYIVLSIIPFISPWVGGLFRWLLGSRPPRSEQQVDDTSDGVPIRLAAKHIKTPSLFPLKGKRVVATGLITKLDYIDTERPNIELHAFPFTIDAEIDCEFPKTYATDLHHRKPL